MSGGADGSRSVWQMRAMRVLFRGDGRRRGVLFRGERSGGDCEAACVHIFGVQVLHAGMWCSREPASGIGRAIAACMGLHVLHLAACAVCVVRKSGERENALAHASHCRCAAAEV